MKKSLSCLIAISLLWSCAPKKYSAILLPETDYVNLDTLEVTAPREYDEEGEAISLDEMDEDTLAPPRYNPSAKRTNDLLHTKLDLRFDWAKEQVLGKATLTLKPYFYPTDRVTLDAKGFQFHKVNFEGSAEQLKYDYDSSQVTIHLGKTLTRNQEYKLFIDYTATPAASGGSAAITSDKGLFFINPQGKEADKPQQIWTQGETENNSRWFPTIDKPNERATNEITLTVEDRFKTLSNGVLASSKKNADGTRTDHWKMDMPHAPYLVMLAVGEYAVVSDKWNGKPVDYYVEPKFEKHARSIFPHTPEMLQFFSDKLGVAYPWQKYSQVVVRDYVSGAMENTTAVIFGEFMQGTDRQLVDARQNETIVAHEMFHHWFGDYVTCESWANLTLNEGFANYSEYLWLEQKHGRNEADFHRLNEIGGYMQQAAQGAHPLIHFGYHDKEDMFDAHSYNKGGLVLHMLRNYVGDEAFFTALRQYLKNNAFTEVEADELRLAFEDVTGEDLNWFFDQWFFEEGHPELVVEYDYDEEYKEAVVTVKQVQDPKQMPAVFQLPFAMDVYTGGKATRHNLRLDQRTQTFRLPSAKDPDLIVFDADGVLLADVHEEKSMEEYIHQYRHATNLMPRIKALGEILQDETAGAETIKNEALDDGFWVFRLFGVDASNPDDGVAMQRIATMAEKDSNSDVRATAIRKLGETGDKQYAPLVARAIGNDPAIKVVSAALETLLALDKEAALAAAQQLEKEDDEGIVLALAGLYAEAGDPQRLRFFEEKFNKVGGFNQVTFVQHYARLAQSGDPDAMLRAANHLKAIAMNEAKLFWMRFMVTKSINEMHAALAGKTEAADASAKTALQSTDAELVKIIEAIKAWETDERVLNMYLSLPDPAPRP